MADMSNSKTLFFTTSPRSPLKMIPEIALLNRKYTGVVWNTDTQVAFMKDLIKEDCFCGGNVKDLAFAARDRITRAPKALGFVDLKPTIKLTDAGISFTSNKREDEALLRQLLKFQLPSPFHTQNYEASVKYNVKPYLEMFRLVSTLGHLTFEEAMIFGMQLTDFNKFDEIVAKINKFRVGIKNRGSVNYKKYVDIYFTDELKSIYSDEISSGNTETRESRDYSVEKFLKTKKSNLHDYTDACFRYLRATKLVDLSQQGHSLSIAKGKERDVQYILDTIDRTPVFIHNETEYKKYLYDSTIPLIYTDSRDKLIEFIHSNQAEDITNIYQKTTEELKDIRESIVSKEKEAILAAEVSSIKDYEMYDDIIKIFSDILSKNVYDQPLMLEWNVWRAMTMLDGGTIVGNFKRDDNGEPLSTATGGMPDIECDYGKFSVIIEVTMQTGAKQYDTEGEPVFRHLGKYKNKTGKCAFCLFIAPKITSTVISYFYSLHKVNIKEFGGKSIIIPITIEMFVKMISNAKMSGLKPDSNRIRELGKYSLEIANKSDNDNEWYEAIQNKIENWMIV